MTARSSTTGLPWVVAFGPTETTAEERARVRAALDGHAALHGAVALATCRRLEFYGVGDPAALDGPLGAAGTSSRGREIFGRAAVEHVLRLAAGLESSVVGEDQILNQIRAVLSERGTPRQIDTRLRRLVEVAIGVGRRARAGRPPQVDRSLADRALAWLGRASGSLAGKTVVVAGAGPIGAAAARGAARHGAEVVVASRDPRHAEALADSVGGRASRIVDVLPELRGADALVVALAGPWTDLSGAPDPLPWTVDLSAPTATPSDVVVRLGDRFANLEGVAEPRAGQTPEARAIARYVARAEDLVAVATDDYEAWLAGRPSVTALRSLRSRAEARRAAELDRLFRRLPALGARERELIERLSRQLVAAMLHEPSRRLRGDRDGSGLAAARELFELDVPR